ncbi:Peptidase S10 serine carboxypeptidase [Arabidopsis thaliana x Arabidopsis arenosa]|uniref:Peptidase S10 serine carboxypeptidase n=1 Tax=Arabidopsis thaliana x Arabidopsis arenosa TaxID=1240361 RepID=A0A8T2AUS2_9BRAS|nr:Peptidase S10 serine carboxypeptidase [Arabidopsis thaliana x Arabidopsis arenosa]
MGQKYYFSWILKLHLLLVLIQLVDSGSTIRFLPGFQGPLPFELETGYIGVGEAEEDQMFYYFIKSERNPDEDPLLLWLSGGPGCSSFSGLVYENGPLAFKVEAYNGSIPSLVSTTYSWTKVASIIYLDQPVGTGFSYSKNPLADDIPNDKGAAKSVHEFVCKWLAKYPEFLSNPFYVTGNSYSGIIIPIIVQEISNGNLLDRKPPINLQGYLLGNPVTDFNLDHNSRIPFAHDMALISDEHYESLKRSCQGDYCNVDPLNTKCLKFVEHFEKGSIREWLRCNWDMPYKRNIWSSVPYHKNTSIKGYRSLIFSGDHDMVVPFLATQAWIRYLNYSIIDDWRPWMIQNQVAGEAGTLVSINQWRAQSYSRGG